MMRLDKYLAERTGMTRSESRKAVTKGRVSIDGVVCRKADTQLDEHTAAVALDGEVRAMENGLNTVIGSGGVRLSGGQAQRLALARTLAHPRPVLVLDDPFSALDRSTEDTVFANLQEYAKDKVVFLISHRLYHFPQMQKIIFMDGGRTTVGTHAQLMEIVPVYRQLYQSQTAPAAQEGGELHEE